MKSKATSHNKQQIGLRQCSQTSLMCQSQIEVNPLDERKISRVGDLSENKNSKQFCVFFSSKAERSTHYTELRIRWEK